MSQAAVEEKTNETVRRAFDLIDIPALTVDEFAARLEKTGVTQTQLADLTGLSRLRIRKILRGDESTVASSGHMFGYLTLVLVLLESNLLKQSVIGSYTSLVKGLARLATEERAARVAKKKAVDMEN